MKQQLALCGLDLFLCYKHSLGMHTCHILNNIEARLLLVLSHGYHLSLFLCYCDGPIVVISLCFGKHR